jgi:hypothetical protein
MRRTDCKRANSRALALRRLLTALLAVTYLLVGLGGEISCAEETLEAASSASISLPEASAATEKSEQGSQKAPTVVEHCYTCVPLLLPAPVLVAEPSAGPARLAFASVPFLVEDHPGLDTPPPKHRA